MSVEEQRPAKPPAKRQNARIAVAAGLGGVVTLFAVLNLDDVEVNWVLGTWSTPLIIVIVLSFAAGMAIDRALVRRGRSPKRRDAKQR